MTLTLIDQSWVDKESQGRLNAELQEFTNRNGIRVEVLPAPEAAVEQLATWRGLKRSAATLGGNGYGVSRHSRHPREAAMLVRYLCGREQQRKRCVRSSEPSTIPDFYSLSNASRYISERLDSAFLGNGQGITGGFSRALGGSPCRAYG
ncbi:MAG: hypothetical protein EHM23_29530 [Acidobacteria bacterium]|nr:MAG: hypothetical protein EHM23_29530 [Acidobacteriota bacterium]